jgi:hypothetical protein
MSKSMQPDADDDSEVDERGHRIRRYQQQNRHPRFWPNLKFLLLYLLLGAWGGWCLSRLSRWKADEPMFGFLLCLPIIAWLLPSWRQRGGSFRGGCLLVVFVLFFTCYFAIYPVTERIVIPRLDPNQPVTCGGLRLGESREEVEKVVGGGEVSAVAPVPGYLTFHYPHHDVVYATDVHSTKSDRAVLISGESLEQNAHQLLRVGQPKRQVFLLAPDESPVMRFPCSGGVLDCQASNGRLTQVRVMVAGLPHGVENPAAASRSLDGLILGMSRQEVIRLKGEGSTQGKYMGLSLECYSGSTWAFYNDDYLVGVVGERLNGGPKPYARGQYGSNLERFEVRQQHIFLYGQGGRLVDVAMAQSVATTPVDHFCIDHSARTGQVK